MKSRKWFTYPSLSLLLIMTFISDFTWSNQQQPVVRETAYRGDSLMLDGFTGDVKLRVGDTSDIQIQLKGTKDAVDLVNVYQDESTIIIKQKEGVPMSQGISVIHMGTGESKVIIGNGHSQIFLGSVNDQKSDEDSVQIMKVPGHSLELLITVPRRTPVHAQNLVGDLEFGSTNGPFQLAVDTADAVIGEVGDTVLNIDGSADVVVAAVTGNLDINCLGSGGVRVEGGQIDLLDVNIQGACDVWVDAHAERARLQNNGAGDIYVSEVVAQPDIRHRGIGEITVGNW